jgi:peptide-methionine (R)-S-oxide reductase
MMNIKKIYPLTTVFLLPMLMFLYSCNNSTISQSTDEMTFPNAKSEEEWREILTPFQYQVLRESATERAFTGEYYNSKDTGTYYCVGCGDRLFSSDTKFDSGCGWPSFFEPASEKSIVYKEDRSHGMIRTEVICGGCGGHLGHVFDDGPPPTGKRYCINSAAIRFEKSTNGKKKDTRP